MAEVTSQWKLFVQTFKYILIFLVGSGKNSMYKSQKCIK